MFNIHVWTKVKTDCDGLTKMIWPKSPGQGGAAIIYPFDSPLRWKPRFRGQWLEVQKEWLEGIKLYAVWISMKCSAGSLNYSKYWGRAASSVKRFSFDTFQFLGLSLTKKKLDLQQIWNCDITENIKKFTQMQNSSQRLQKSGLAQYFLVVGWLVGCLVICLLATLGN